MKKLIFVLALLSTQAMASELSEVNEFIKTELAQGKSHVEWQGKTSKGNDCRFTIWGEHGLRLDLSGDRAQVVITTEGEREKPRVNEFKVNRHNELTSLKITLSQRKSGNYLFAKSHLYTTSMKIKKVKDSYVIEGIRAKGFIPKVQFHENCTITDFTNHSRI